MIGNWSELQRGGVSIPGFTRRMDRPAMIAYAGATWDWHRLHYDTEFARGLGFSAPVVDGQVFGALMAECVQDWLGPAVWLSALSFRFKTPVLAGSKVRCEGETVESVGEELLCNLRISVVDDSGNEISTAAVGEAKAVRR